MAILRKRSRAGDRSKASTGPGRPARVCVLLHKSVVHDARVRREAAALAAEGYAVTLVELDPAAAGRLDGFARVSAAPPGWVRRALPFQLYRLVFLAAFLARIVRLRPDIVHANDAAMLLPGLLGARLVRARLVYDSHELATGVPYRDGRWARFVSWIERIGVPRADAVITVSDGIANRLRAQYGLAATPTVVRNVCALPPPRPDGSLRRSLGVGDAPLILHQGAAAKSRGCEVLVRAVARLDDAHLVFLGAIEPAVADAVVQEAAAVDGHRVHFADPVALDGLLSATAEADVGVSLLQDTCENHRLALPNKLFEYVAAGIPVVVSDLPELGRFVREERVGWAAPAADPEAIASALEEALAAARTPELRERVRSAAERLTWTAERRRLLALYRSLRPPRD